MCNLAFAKTPEMLAWFFQSLECLEFHVWPKGLHKLMYISFQSSDLLHRFTPQSEAVLHDEVFTGHVCQLYSPPD